jgi:membrane associated rhomboid family serine protease
MIPVYDESGGRLFGFKPWVTWSLVALNTTIALFLALLPGLFVEIIVHQFGLVPALVTGASSIGAEDFLFRPELTLLTYGFIHAKWSHLASNMLVLWVFGDNIEKATGHFRFLLFYLLCQIAGAMAHVVSDPGSLAPAIGASAAVSGVVGAYLLVRPRARVVMLVLGVMTINFPAYWVIIGWFVTQVAGFWWFGSDVSIAYWGHFGGFAAGLLLVVIFKRPNARILGERSLRAVWRVGIARAVLAGRCLRAAESAHVAVRRRRPF